MKKKYVLFAVLFIGLLLSSCTKGSSSLDTARGTFIKSGNGYALEEELTGEYSIGGKKGTFLYSIYFEDTTWNVYIELKEDGEMKALSTLNTLSEEYTLVRTSSDESEVVRTGSAVKNSENIYDTIEFENCAGLFINLKNPQVQIECADGSYNLGTIDTSSLEAFYYDRAWYEKITSLIEEEEYGAALKELNEMENNDSRSYHHYGCDALEEECYEPAYKKGLQYYLNREYEKAAEELHYCSYEDALTIYSDCCYQIGLVAKEEGDYRKAADAFEEGGWFTLSDECYDLAGEGDYADALSLFEKGEYSAAMEKLRVMVDYSDESEELFLECRSLLGLPVPGDIIEFGHDENGNAIEWIVLEMNDDYTEAFLLSRYILGFFALDTSAECEWGTSALRASLNDETSSDSFILNFLTEEERGRLISKKIKTVETTMGSNKDYVYTYDKVFIPSREEIESLEDLYSSGYVAFFEGESESWRLRDLYVKEGKTGIVTYDGDKDNYWIDITEYSGLRPALWVTTE